MKKSGMQIRIPLMLSYDLKDQYHQIRLNKNIWKFFGFAIPCDNGEMKYFVYTVLPFGLNLAVNLVTRMFKPIKAGFHKYLTYTFSQKYIKLG